MILTYFGNNLPRPYLLINKLITIIDTDNKINGGTKQQRLMFSNVEIEEKRIFIVRVQTER